MSNPITTILIWLIFSAVLSIAYFILLSKRKTTHRLNYATHWSKYEKAINEGDINAINEFGQKVIWNEFIKVHHKKKMYTDIKSLISNHPELKALWFEVHYKVLGIEPN